VLFLNVSDIDWIEAAGYYTCLHVGPDTHILRRSLSDLERDLGEETFIRIHRSLLVALNRINALELGSSGEHEIVLRTGARLHLSRRYKKPVQERLLAAERK
jgi:two-component system LytT family response regulator